MMRLNFINFLRQPVIFRGKCRVLSRTMYTSSVSQCTYSRNKSVANVAREYFEEEKKNYEDTFGDIDSFEQKFSRIKNDPEDILEYRREKAAQGKTMAQYINEIKSLLENHDYRGALKVLEVDMVNDKKPLNTFIYRILINYNARIGNAKEAYRLFIKFKKRQGIPTGAMYTSVLNACANSKNSYFALEKANAITECMKNNKHHSINTTNYDAMLKAFGRHGDLRTCLKIMDEVSERRDKVDEETYLFLFHACVTDKNSGLRHALIVWRKMLQNLVKPDILIFNILLRCVRECALGDTLLISRIVDDILKESGVYFRKKVKFEKIDGITKRKVLKIPTTESSLTSKISTNKSEHQETDFVQIISSSKSNETNQLPLETESDASSQVEVPHLVDIENRISNMELDKKENSFLSESNENCEKSENNLDFSSSLKGTEFPNLLSLRPTRGNVIRFHVMTKPKYRFMLVGGVKGFLKTMDEFGVIPNIKTFTLMFDLIPSTLEAEEELLSLAQSYAIKFDVGFFNALMKRRQLRNDNSGAKKCLEYIYSLNLKPDIITFGTLAIGCRTRELGLELLDALHRNGYRAGSEILETLFNNACAVGNMEYVLDILKTARTDETELNNKFLARLMHFVDEEKKKRQEKRRRINQLNRSLEISAASSRPS